MSVEKGEAYLDSLTIERVVLVQGAYALMEDESVTLDDGTHPRHWMHVSTLNELVARGSYRRIKEEVR